MAENPIKDELSMKESYDSLSNFADFKITPQETQLALEDDSRYQKLDISSAQKMQVNALIQQIPQLFASETLKNVYKVEFPKGLPHTLTALKQGGFGSMIRINGKFAGTASLYPLTMQAMALSAFSAMSAVTGQYFLKKIDNELEIVNQKLDDILNFLYGEKKAELIAEIGFVKYAYDNYSSIMMSEDQRTATIVSLQEARKIAMKDIEFYINDFEATLNRNPKDYADMCKTINKALQLKDSIEMSRQLYVVSGILELYYSQNFATEYVDYIENDMIAYVNKCDQQLLGGLSKIQGVLTAYKPKAFEKLDSKDEYIDKITLAAEPYRQGKDSPIRIAMRDTLNTLQQKNEFFIDNTGNVYTRKN